MFPERWIKEVLPERKENPWHNRIHIIKSLTYREATSWAGFFSYKHARNHIKPWEHFFRDFSEFDHELALEQTPKLKARGIDITFEWIEHEDLYAFYDYIGYNRQTKKFEGKK